ncbi:MAG TPA: hypothetical protein VFK11_02555 [Candidatus Saccharimonadales bacterium]|nr:hypothetical protein [Candidatus Saccharimonadales bacterium]
MLSPIKFGINNIRQIGGKTIQIANQVLKPASKESEIEKIMAVNSVPISAKNVVCQLAEQHEIPGLMELNTAQLLWLNRKYHSQDRPGHEGDYVYQTIQLMLDIGIQQEKVEDLIDSDLPRSVIDQHL